AGVSWGQWIPAFAGMTTIAGMTLHTVIPANAGIHFPVPLLGYIGDADGDAERHLSPRRKDYAELRATPLARGRLSRELDRRAASAPVGAVVREHEFIVPPLGFEDVAELFAEEAAHGEDILELRPERQRYR